MKDKYEKRLLKALQKWGIPKLKEKQREILEELITNKKDVIGLLPTGYGKSMTYLLPPLITKKTIIIISPLISLMEDQKEKLVQRNIPVATIHSNNSNKDKEKYKAIDGQINIIYMSPEFLINGEGMELAESLYNTKLLKYFAIDEAHCISAWGHDFRSNYLQICEFREKFPDIPILAVTATATNRVVDDIRTYLKLNNPKIVRANFDRPNLFLDFKQCGAIDPLLVLPYIEKYIKLDTNDRMIIYINNKKECTMLEAKLNSMNFPKLNNPKRICLAYHAGMSKKERKQVHDKFISGEIKIIISTVAFGMGIDQIVRCVLVFGFPSSIEEYYQQIGRAGRDGKEAETVLFYQPKGYHIAKNSLKRYKNEQVVKAKDMNISCVAYLLMSIKTCRRKYILEYFGQPAKFFGCNNCDKCKRTNKDITKKMYKYLIKNKELNKVFKKEDDIKRLREINVINKNNKPNQELINWKRLITVNKITMENMKDKYRIYI